MHRGRLRNMGASSVSGSAYGLGAPPVSGSPYGLGTPPARPFSFGGDVQFAGREPSVGNTRLDVNKQKRLPYGYLTA